MDTTLFSLAAFVLQASVKTTLLIALVLAAQHFFGKLLPANRRYLLWFTVIISLVTPFGFEAALLPDTRVPTHALPAPAFERIATPPADASADTFAIEVRAPYSPPATATDAAMPATTETLPRNWLSVLPYLWLAGVFAVFGAIAMSGLRFARLVQRAQPASAELRNFLRDCMRHISCNRAVAVLQSAEVQVPMIAGQFRPVLLLPEGLERQLTRAQLRHVFIHELMHLQRGDILSNWLVAAVQALHWFNPAVWFAFFRMRQDRELACDAATLRHLAPAEKAAYGHTLLQLNDTLPRARVPAMALGMLQARSHLHQRILMLAGASQGSALHTGAAALICMPLAALAFSQPAPVAVEAVAPLGEVETAVIVSSPAVAPAAAEPGTTRVSATDAASVAAQAPSTGAAPVETAADSGPPAIPEPAAFATPVAELPVPAAPQQTLRNETEDPFAPTAATTVIAAVAAEAVQSPSPAPYAGLPEIEQLAETIAAASTEKLRFIAKWEAIGAACDARKDRFLGALSASCQKIRTAQRRGEIFRFGFECYQLTALSDALFERYRDEAAQQPGLAAVETALRANARNLATFCGKDTYAREYPAFAAMIADAEALKYFPSRQVISSTAMVAAMNADSWRSWSTMQTGSSMYPSGASTVTLGPIEPAYNPAPTASADFGGGTGGGAGVAPAPQ